MKQAQRMALLATALAMATLATGCAVYMAAKQPEKKDISVLREGTGRGHVITELGAPMHTEERQDGRVDYYKFVQGYHPGVKAGRAVFHGVADFFTLGLWEIVGTPIEGIADGTEVKLEVYYDKSDRVRHVKALSGGKVIGTSRAATTK